VREGRLAGRAGAGGSAGARWRSRLGRSRRARRRSAGAARLRRAGRRRSGKRAGESEVAAQARGSWRGRQQGRATAAWGHTDDTGAGAACDGVRRS
jgi:hypothetical protein